MRPDLVLVNGEVATLNSLKPRCEAVAVVFGRVSEVGSTKEVMRSVGSGTRVIDLDGKTVLPGFIDTHVHLDDFGLTLRTINMEGAASVGEVKRLLSERVRRAPEGEGVEREHAS